MCTSPLHFSNWRRCSIAVIHALAIMVLPCEAAPPFVPVGDSFYAVIEDPSGETTVELIGPHVNAAAAALEWPDSFDRLCIFATTETVDDLLADPRVSGVERLELIGAPVSATTLQLIADMPNLNRLSLIALHTLPDACVSDIPIGDSSDEERQTLDLSLLLGLQRLSTLNVLGFQISEDGLRSIEHFPALTSLSIAHAGLVDADLAYVGRAKGIECLNVRGNSITPRGLESLEQLQALRLVLLSQNPLDDLTVDDFAQIGRVHEVYVDRCGIGEQMLNRCRDAFPFTHFDASENSFVEEVGLSGMNPRQDRLHWRSAIEVSTRQCEVCVNDRTFLGVDVGRRSDRGIGLIPYAVQMNGIRWLFAVSAGIGAAEFEILDLLGDCETLEMVDLAGNGVTDDGLSWVADAEHLTQLRIDGNPVTDNGVMQFISQRALERLSMRQTLIGNDAIRSLAGMQSLKELDLRGCRIDDDVVPLIRQLTQLQTIGISGTDITAEGRAELREAFPNAEIR